MRKLMFFLFAIICVSPLMAQQSGVDGLFAQYSGKQGFKTVVLGPKLIEQRVANNEKTSDIAKKIKMIRILSSEVESPELIAKVQAVADSSYEFISTTAENGEVTSFYINEVKIPNKSFLMIAHRSGKEIIMEVCGDFSVTDITQLSKLGTKQK